MWLTVSVSVKGSSADRSSGFSNFLRKCSLRERYALLESESVLAHVDLSRLLNRRNACNHLIVNHALVLNTRISCLPTYRPKPNDARAIHALFFNGKPEI